MLGPAMKHRLLLPLLASVTCLAAWNADASAATEKPLHAAPSGAHAKVKAKAKAKVLKPKVKATPALMSKGKIDPTDALLSPAKVETKPAPSKGKAEAHPLKGKVALADKETKAKEEEAPAAKKHAKPSFWLAAAPHVPLALVEGEAIHPVGQRGKSCGDESRWAAPLSHWKAVDAWGQVTGVFRVAGSDLYDVTQCHEVFFEGQKGEGPGVLFVSEDSGWKPGKSALWKASAAEKKRFESFVGGVEQTFVDKKPQGVAGPLARRTLYFDVPAVEGRPQHWAISGGPILVVAYLGEHGHWKASTVRPPLGLAKSYKPVSVVDMNGDGVPELVYHSDDGPSYADAVLSLNPGSMAWDDAAASPGGATL
jgi:hypothetical protein